MNTKWRWQVRKTQYGEWLARRMILDDATSRYHGVFESRIMPAWREAYDWAYGQSRRCCER